jgi:hypothetical protein
MSERLSFDSYRQIQAVNWTSLKYLRDGSPAHYKYRLDHQREDKPHLAIGRALHVAVFEPDRFALDFAVYDGPTKGEGSRKAKWAFEEANAHRTVLDLDDYELTLAMRDAVRAHPLVAPYLECGVAEESVLFRDPISGLDCKSRLDWVSLSKPGIVDLKSTISSEARRFASMAARFGYHCQGAMYQRGYQVATGETLPFILVAVEKEPPFDVAVFRCFDDDALYAGGEELNELLERVAECRAADHWPGRYETEQALDLPKWVFPDDEDIADGIDFGKEEAA